MCAPDVSFLNNESAAEGDPDHIFQGAPDLAIELISESENALELREKIQNYLDAGSKAVWAFYPNVRVIAVYDKSGVEEIARRSDPGSPRNPAWLPGQSRPVLRLVRQEHASPPVSVYQL